MSPRVTFYSRVGCHLCDEARLVLDRVCADLGVSYDEVDIDEDPGLREAYGEEVPVTLVDGRRHAIWRLDEQRLRAALTR